jgi:hypothetical protein
MEIKLGAKAMGCKALENNEGLSPDTAKVEVTFGEFDEPALMSQKGTISLSFCYPFVLLFMQR